MGTYHLSRLGEPGVAFKPFFLFIDPGRAVYENLATVSYEAEPRS